MVDVTGTTNLYTSYLLDTFRGGVFSPETDAMRMGLAGPNYVPVASHSSLTDITDEPAQFGYSRQTLQNVQILEEAGFIKLTWDPFVEFSIAGGNLSLKYWFIFDDTAVNDRLVGWGKINGQEDDPIVLVDGFSLQLRVNELGLFRVPL